MTPRLAFVLGALLLPGVVRAQDGTAKPGDDRWQIELENGQFVWDIRLLRLQGDSLMFRQADTVGAVRVQQMTEIRLIQKTEIRLGDAGAAAGSIRALTGADDEVYDLRTLDFAARLRTIQQILLMHPGAS